MFICLIVCGTNTINSKINEITKSVTAKLYFFVVAKNKLDEDSKKTKKIIIKIPKLII